jgi:hypothetical protein
MKKIIHAISEPIVSHEQVFENKQCMFGNLSHYFQNYFGMQGVPKKTVVLFKSNFPNPLRRSGASVNPSFIKRDWVDLEPLMQDAY